MAAIPLSRSALTDEEAVATTAHADILPRRTEKKGSAKLAIPSHALATEKIAHLGDTPLAAVPYATSVAKEAMQEEEVITIAVEKVCRSEEHTSELQSRQYLVCRLLLEKKKHALVSPRT